MSKLLWRALIVSPAVLGATLLVSAGAVRAAGGDSLLTKDSQSATAEVQPQTAEVQTPEAQSQAIAPTAELALPEAQPKLEFSATPAPAQPKLADLNLPSQVSLNPTQLTPVNEAGVEAAPAAIPPAIAQSAPGDANSADVLNQINRYSREGNNATQEQVTNVSQLSDVRPTDWAYEALRSLVERYGCIAGYPDGTFRGNRAMTRYEFAAGLNACLQQIERQLGQTGDFATRADLETLQRLVDEFRTELATLGTRVDQLEGRVGFLEDHQFSTTTKLAGEAIFALTDEFGRGGVSNNTVFQDRVRLTFNTSFTGRDRLVTRLAAGNATRFAFSEDALGNRTLLDEGQQTFNIGNTGNNDVVLDWLAYYFNFGSSKVYLAATGGIHSDYAPTLNPYFEDYDGGNGALSTFAQSNPIYRIGGGAGGAISLGVGPLQSILGPSTLTIGYLAGANNGGFGANDPSEKAGLFDGDYSALAQLNFNLGDRIGVGATYVHGYHNSGTDIFDLGGGTDARVVGSALANRPSSLLIGGERPVVTNSYGGELAFRLSENISISGFGTYTQATVIGRGRGDIWTYGAGVALSDFGKPGSVLGLFAGVEPTLRGVSPGLRGLDARPFSRDNVWHFEGFYKYKLNDNISVTPGVIWVTAPGQNEDERDAVIGTLRTTFTF
ncbi:iron uptake porin [Allocoleopsis franciscana]|uniref:Carbohydrate-selective porin n=1 Tax=Allocoleopsis franciscana PCC 7113 TaxID=1173027 RepID=K9WNN3_9CYAN|nr:iron uptake porin [Allocoleopsis franciscana]AFZ21122.1 carbohydrate-selective porin [Allocoleopsis franciscana PCC 7113]